MTTTTEQTTPPVPRVLPDKEGWWQYRDDPGAWEILHIVSYSSGLLVQEDDGDDFCYRRPCRLAGEWGLRVADSQGNPVATPAVQRERVLLPTDDATVVKLSTLVGVIDDDVAEDCILHCNDILRSLPANMDSELDILRCEIKRLHEVCDTNEMLIAGQVSREQKFTAENMQLEKERDALRMEVERLKRGDWTPVEIQEICHNLHKTVDAEGFAAGCEAEQRRLYGCAPDADAVQRLTRERNAVVESLGAVTRERDGLRERVRELEKQRDQYLADAKAMSKACDVVGGKVMDACRSWPEDAPRLGVADFTGVGMRCVALYHGVYTVFWRDFTKQHSETDMQGRCGPIRWLTPPAVQGEPKSAFARKLEADPQLAEKCETIATAIRQAAAENCNDGSVGEPRIAAQPPQPANGGNANGYECAAQWRDKFHAAEKEREALLAECVRWQTRFAECDMQKLIDWWNEEDRPAASEAFPNEGDCRTIGGILESLSMECGRLRLELACRAGEPTVDGKSLTEIVRENHELRGKMEAMRHWCAMRKMHVGYVPLNLIAKEIECVLDQATAGGA